MVEVIHTPMMVQTVFLWASDWEGQVVGGREKAEKTRFICTRPGLLLGILLHSSSFCLVSIYLEREVHEMQERSRDIKSLREK